MQFIHADRFCELDIIVISVECLCILSRCGCCEKSGVCESVCVVVVLMLAATAPTFSSVTTCATVPMVTTLLRLAPAAEHMQPPGESHQSHPRNMEHFNCDARKNLS